MKEVLLRVKSYQTSNRKEASIVVVFHRHQQNLPQPPLSSVSFPEHQSMIVHQQNYYAFLKIQMTISILVAIKYFLIKVLTLLSLNIMILKISKYNIYNADRDFVWTGKQKELCNSLYSHDMELNL